MNYLKKIFSVIILILGISLTGHAQLTVADATPVDQEIPYNGIPPLIQSAGVTGGGSSNPHYVYQWQQAHDFITWTNVPGANALTLQITSGLTQIMQYRLTVTDLNTGATGASAAAFIDTDPQLIIGSITPSVQTVDYNTTVSITASQMSGGSGINFYQWQISTDNVNWTNYSPQTGPNPQSTLSSNFGPMTGTTYIRLVVTSDGATCVSQTATVYVNPPPTPGAVYPSTNITVLTGTSPGTLGSDPATGGVCNGNYSYQWETSTDNKNWTSAGAGLTYTPPALSTQTYFHLKISCGAEASYSQVITINMGSSSPDLTYVRARTINRSGVTDLATAAALTDPRDVQQSTNYFDGLGRPLETVERQNSPLGKDAVSFHFYDNFGRESRVFLPYISPSSDGNYKYPLGEQNAFNTAQYPGEQQFYGQTVYESSMLERISQVYQAGGSWIGSGRGVVQGYKCNAIGDSVRIWNIDTLSGSLPVSSSYYSAGQLFKNLNTDEQGHQSVEYKDKDGHVILKKQQLADAPGTGYVGWLCTYYIYDDIGNLRFVIPPTGVQWLNSNGWSFGTSGGPAVAANLCFRYEYDNRARMIIKKIPGATGEVQMVYDTRDLLVMTSDTNNRHDGYWLVTRFDNLDRPDSMGKLVDANTRAYHQNLAGNSNNYPVITGTGYTSYIRTFYDDYSWLPAGAPSLNGTFSTKYVNNSSYFITGVNTGPVYAQPIVQSTATRGLVTGTATDVIGSVYNIFKVNFYDDRARLLQSTELNFQGGTDTTTFQYDFTGKVLRKLLTQRDPSSQTPLSIISTRMTYDAMARPTSTRVLLTGATADQLIDSIKYDELGRLSTKYLGNNVDSLISEYNIRGWLTGINRAFFSGTPHYFGMELGYDRATSVAAGTSYGGLQFNGNIAGMVWKSAGDGVNRKYNFSYDNVNRLTDAGFAQSVAGGAWGNSAMDFSAHNLTYDANGNILTMSQHGWKLGNPMGAIDSLTYGYLTTSNQLNQVTDAVNDTASVLGDFHYKAAKTGQDYRYDNNGSLIVDRNKGLQLISHNFLNLPTSIAVPGRGSIQFDYTADGTKVRKIVYDSVTHHQIWTVYTQGLVFNRVDSFVSIPSVHDTLQFVQLDEGRARWALHHYTNGTSGYGWEYDFMEQDHLGNTRVLLTQEKDTAHYMATMEAAYRATEMALFYNIDSTSSAKPAGYPTTDNTTSPNDSVALVDGNLHKMGPAILLKVMSGDTLQLLVNSYYKSGGTNGNNGSSVQSVLNSLASGLITLAGPGHGSAASLTGTGSPVYTAVNSFIPGQEADTTGKPKAYLNWMLLDNQFNYVAGNGQSGAQRVKGADVISPLTGTVNVKNSGYLYIWVSNETKGWNVFFDNLSVVHRSGPMLEENHYYPFGLTMAGISDKAFKGNYAENKYRFNKGTELQNKEFADGSGLELYETPLRSLDPELGRWWQLDSKPTEAESPYSAMGNNPILKNDPLGDSSCCTLAQIYTGTIDVVRTINTTINPLTPIAELITGKSAESDFSEDKPRSTSALESAIMLVPGAKIETAISKVSEKAVVSLDNNALIHAVEGGGKDAVKKAIGGATPIVSATAAKEFLAKGDKQALKSFMQEIGATISKQGASTEQVNTLKATAERISRTLGTNDASIIGGAINNQATVITRDDRMTKFMQAIGLPVIGF